MDMLRVGSSRVMQQASQFRIVHICHATHNLGDAVCGVLLTPSRRPSADTRCYQDGKTHFEGLAHLKGDADAFAGIVERRAAAVAAVDRGIDLHRQQLRAAVRIRRHLYPAHHACALTYQARPSLQLGSAELMTGIMTVTAASCAWAPLLSQTCAQV